MVDQNHVSLPGDLIIDMESPNGLVDGQFLGHAKKYYLSAFIQNSDALLKQLGHRGH